METQQLTEIVLDNVKSSKACVDAKISDGGRAGDYLEHVKGFYNVPEERQAHLAGIQDYLADVYTVEVQGVFKDPQIKLFRYGKYISAAISSCVLAVPLYPVLGFVAAASAGVSIACSKLLKRREKKLEGLESGLKEDVMAPISATMEELKAMDISELELVLQQSKEAISQYLLQ